MAETRLTDMSIGIRSLATCLLWSRPFHRWAQWFISTIDESEKKIDLDLESNLSQTVISRSAVKRHALVHVGMSRIYIHTHDQTMTMFDVKFMFHWPLSSYRRGVHLLEREGNERLKLTRFSRVDQITFGYQSRSQSNVNRCPYLSLSGRWRRPYFIHQHDDDVVEQKRPRTREKIVKNFFWHFCIYHSASEREKDDNDEFSLSVCRYRFGLYIYMLSLSLSLVDIDLLDDTVYFLDAFQILICKDISFSVLSENVRCMMNCLIVNIIARSCISLHHTRHQSTMNRWIFNSTVNKLSQIFQWLID